MKVSRVLAAGLLASTLTVLAGVATASSGPSLTAPLSRSAGIDPPVPELPSTTVSRTIKSGGRLRTYNVYRPARVTLAPAPLVLVLHGIGMTAEDMQHVSHFDVQAELSGFIAVFPQGWGNSWNGVAVRCCGEAGRLRVDDGRFINDIIVQASKDYLVDPKRVYVAGFSNGAVMAYNLACRYPTRFAAVASVAGFDLNFCRTKTPLSLLHLHGLSDRVVSFSAVGKLGVQQWRWIDRCPKASVSYAAPLHSDLARPCRSGTAVELYTVDGMDHLWPSRFDPLSPVGVDATSMIWDFFASHSR